MSGDQISKQQFIAAEKAAWKLFRRSPHYPKEKTGLTRAQLRAAFIHGFSIGLSCAICQQESPRA